MNCQRFILLVVLAGCWVPTVSLSIAQPVLRLDGSGGFDRADAAAAVAAIERAEKAAAAEAESLGGSLARLAGALIEGGLAQATAGGLAGDDAERVSLGLFIESRLNAAIEAEASGRVRPSTASAAAIAVRSMTAEVEAGTADAQATRRRLQRALAPVAAEAGIDAAGAADPAANRPAPARIDALGLDGDAALRLMALGDGDALISPLAAVLVQPPAWVDAPTRAAATAAVTGAIERAERGDWSGFAALHRWARTATLWTGADATLASALREHEQGMKLWIESLAGGREPRWALMLTEILTEAGSPLGREDEVLRPARPLWRHFAGSLREARAAAVVEAKRLYRDGSLTDPALVVALSRLREARRDVALIRELSAGVVDRERPGVMEPRKGWATPALALVEAGKGVSRATNGEAEEAAAAARGVLAACGDALAVERAIADSRAPISDEARSVASAHLEAWVRSLRGGKELAQSPEQAALANVARVARLTERARWHAGDRAAWWAWPATDAIESHAKRELTAAVVRAWSRIERGDLAAAAREVDRAERDQAPGLLAAAISRRLDSVAGDAERDPLRELCLLRDAPGLLDQESHRIARAGWMWLESRGPRPVTFGRLAREAAEAVLERLEER